MKGKIIIAISLGVLIGLLLVTRAARQAHSDQLQNPYSGIASVNAINAHEESFARIVSATGTLVGKRESMISAQSGGQIVAIFVETGDRVAANDPIMRIDDELYGLEAERARVTYEKAQMDYERVLRLHEQKSASDSDLEGARLMVKGAEVAYKMAEKTFNDATVKAPFSGIITERLTEVGQMIGAGMPVVQLLDNSSMKLTLQIPEGSVRYLTTGGSAAIYIDALGLSVEGEVTSIGSKSSTGARTFPVEVRLPGGEGIRSGMFARAEINAGNYDTVVLPRVAILPDAGKSVVYIARDNLAEKVVVNLLGQHGDKVAVEGISPGDIVITTGNQSLMQGTSLNLTMTEMD